MPETALRLRLFGDSILRKKARPVKKITAAEGDTLSQMARIMYESSGIGLAAPQVGISQALIVADVGSGLYKLVNPKIVQKHGQQALEEGCLSVPGVCIKVKRAEQIMIKAQDEFGKAITIEARELLACVFQHEIDHLRGKLHIDYASFFEKLKIKQKLAELSRQSKEIEGGIPPAYQIGLAGKKRVQDERLFKQETKSCKLQL